MAKKAGRPRRAKSGEPTRLIPIRMTETERNAYQQAAERAGVSFSEWARARLTAIAAEETKTGPLDYSQIKSSVLS